MGATILDTFQPSLLWRWDVPTLSWVTWDGSLTVGSLVIGAVTQSGTWTVQPGNTANTTAWKVDGSAVTQPVSGTFWQATQPVSAVSLPLPTGAATSALQTQPGVDIGDVTVNNGVAGAAVNVQDGGNSLTIDAVSLPLPTGAATAALQTQPGVDIGDVTINNGAAGAAVNVQDGGNSLTVDGTVTANPATAFGKTITYVNVNQGVAGTTVLAAASASNKHKIVGLALTLSLAGTLKLTDGVVDLIGPFDFLASGGLVIPAGALPMSETAAVNRALNLVTTLGAARGVVAILTEP